MTIGWAVVNKPVQSNMHHNEMVPRYNITLLEDQTKPSSQSVFSVPSVIVTPIQKEAAKLLLQ